MKDYQKSFLNLAIESQALQFGEFTLKSGRQSPYFFNAANMLKGSNLFQLAQCYVDAIIDNNIEFDCIYGPAYKGIFLGSIVATVFSEQGTSASHMAAAKFLDTIARLSDCDGQDADATSAYTQVNLDEFQDAELVDRGYEDQIIFFEVKNEKIKILYSSFNGEGNFI